VHTENVLKGAKTRDQWRSGGPLENQ